MPWSDAYVGMPYKSMGRDENGIDCWGLVRFVLLKEKGLNLPAYNEDDSDGATIAFHARKWPSVQIKDAKEFDVAILLRPVVINHRWVNKPNHIGIFVNEKSILHINEKSYSIVQFAKQLKIHRILRVI